MLNSVVAKTARDGIGSRPVPSSRCSASMVTANFFQLGEVLRRFRRDRFLDRMKNTGLLHLAPIIVGGGLPPSHQMQNSDGRNRGLVLPF